MLERLRRIRRRLWLTRKEKQFLQFIEQMKQAGARDFLDNINWDEVNRIRTQRLIGNPET